MGVPTTDKGTSKGVTAPTVLNEQLSPIENYMKI